MMFKEGFDSYACVGEAITCEVDGFDVTARIHSDDDSTPPWKRDDGHGPVSEWTSREPGKGERVLNSSGGSFRYYDFDEAKRIALRDGWGGEGIKGNRYQKASKAAERDFEVLKAWCDDEWTYVGVSVSVSRCGVELTGEYDHALWGVEMNYPNSDNSYLTEVANEQLPQALEAARNKLQELAASSAPAP